jgi:hypothetical protein
MQFQALTALRNEFKKFTGFMIPDFISEPSTQAVAYLSSEDICLPIEDATSPPVVAFSAILNSKRSKSLPSLISPMCSCLASEALTGDAMLSVVHNFESAADSVDSELGLKIIQFATTSAGSRFLDIQFFQSILSLVFAFCASKNEFTTTAAFAAAGQIFDCFFVNLDTLHENLSVVNKRDIQDCFAKNCEAMVDFDRPLYKIVYLILRDLSRMCNDSAPVWINHHAVHWSIAVRLLGNLVASHSAVFAKSADFLQLIANAMTAVEGRDAPLSFSVICMDAFMESLPAPCLAHFSGFVDSLRPMSARAIRALHFFRIFLLKKSSVVVRFFTYCDPTASLLSRLVQILKEFTERNSPRGAVQLSLNSIGYDPPPDHFLSSAPVEVAVSFIQSCYDARDPITKTLISAIWSDVIVVIEIALSWVTGTSCYVLMQNLHLLLVLASEFDMDDARSVAVAAFSSVLLSPNEAVSKTGFDTLAYAIESSPAVFAGSWTKVLPVLADLEWAPSSLGFTTAMPLQVLGEFTRALLDIRGPWATALIVDLLITNDNRFPGVFSQIHDGFDVLIRGNPEPLFALMSRGCTERSSPHICGMVESAIRAGGPVKDILEHIRTMVANCGTVITDWPPLLRSLYPGGCAGHVALAFRIVQMICSDVLFALSGDVQEDAIRLIFEFARQTEDTNVALSALGLLWNVVAVAKAPKIWMLLFAEHLPLIADPRPDVSLCAVKTLFSLIVSNWPSLPPEVFTYLADECFPQIIRYLESPHPGSELTQQFAFNELAHCGWTLPHTFESELWFRLIDLHSDFMQRCKNRDATVAAFQFYEEAFKISSDVKSRLFEKLDRLADFLIRTEAPQSSLYGAIGRLIRIVMPRQREGLTDSELSLWLRLIEKLIFEIDCDHFLPPTTHKSLDALVLLLPLPGNQVEMIYRSIVEMACNSKQNARLTDVALQHISDICEQKVTDDLVPSLFVLSAPLFALRPARRLLLFFVEKDMKITDELLENVCNSLIELGQAEPELTVQTGANLLKLFTRMSDAQKLRVVEAHAGCYRTQTALWRIYLDPTSPEFDEKSALLCTKPVVLNIGQFVCSSNEDFLDKVLRFVKERRTVGRAFGDGKLGEFRHLNALMPRFADLVMHPSEEMRKSLREIFLLLVDD